MAKPAQLSKLPGASAMTEDARPWMDTVDINPDYVIYRCRYCQTLYAARILDKVVRFAEQPAAACPHCGKDGSQP